MHISTVPFKPCLRFTNSTMNLSTKHGISNKFQTVVHTSSHPHNSLSWNDIIVWRHTYTRHMSDSRISLYLYYFGLTLYWLDGNGHATHIVVQKLWKQNNITRNASSATRVCFHHSMLHHTHCCKHRSRKVHQNPLVSCLCMELDISVFWCYQFNYVQTTYQLSHLSLLLSTDYSLVRRLSWQCQRDIGTYSTKNMQPIKLVPYGDWRSTLPNWRLCQLQSHVTQKLGQISKIRPIKFRYCALV